MAAHPIVVVGDGIIEIPENLKHDPRFQKGARLELVPVAVADTQDRPKGDWRRLRGIMKDLPVNLVEEHEKERLAELALDERMMRGTSESR